MLIRVFLLYDSCCTLLLSLLICSSLLFPVLLLLPARHCVFPTGMPGMGGMGMGGMPGMGGMGGMGGMDFSKMMAGMGGGKQQQAYHC